MSLRFEAGFDIEEHIARFGAVSIHVVETGGTTFDADITDGFYFMNTDGSAALGQHQDEVIPYIRFVPALVAELQSHHAGTGTYGFNYANGVITLDHTGGTVSAIAWTFSAGAQALLGFPASPTGLSITSPTSARYYIDCDAGFWTGMTQRQRGKVAKEVLAHDKTPGGLAHRVADQHWDFVVPLEARRKVWPWALSAAFYTWKDFFDDVRNVHPIAVEDGFDGGVGLTYALLREEGSLCEPEAIGGDVNYVAQLDIPIRSRILAHGT
jgi:hypothetical protein